MVHEFFYRLTEIQFHFLINALHKNNLRNAFDKQASLSGPSMTLK